MVTVVTEGIFSYCSFKVKIDTDRFLGAEQANVRYHGEVVGHVTTAEYGSQMLSLGGVHHLTGGSKKEGRMTCELMLALGNKQAVECTIDGGASMVIQAGARADRQRRRRAAHARGLRLGGRRHLRAAALRSCRRSGGGRRPHHRRADRAPGRPLPRHDALGHPKMRGRKSTPGRYFQVANPGNGWGGTDIHDPLSIIEGWDASAWRGRACAC